MYTAIFSEYAVEACYHLEKKKVDIFNIKQVMELFRNSGTPVCTNNIEKREL
jgi:hypothetical protein